MENSHLTALDQYPW